MYISQREGFSALFRGVLGNVSQGMVRAGIFLPAYQQTLTFVKENVTTHEIGLPLLSSTIARICTVVLTFPIENYSTRMQATKATDAKINVKPTTGFLDIAARDTLFTAIFWTLNENIRSNLANSG